VGNGQCKTGSGGFIFFSNQFSAISFRPPAYKVRASNKVTCATACLQAVIFRHFLLHCLQASSGTQIDFIVSETLKPFSFILFS
jgi:hypothetical protein